MNANLTRIAMVLPIVAALLALTSGWASAQPGPDFPDSISDSPIVDPQPPKPPKWQDVPVVDLGDITADPDPAPPADPPADPAPADDSDSDDDSDTDDNGKNTVHPAVGKPVPAVAETDSEFQASDATNASESISPKYLQSTGVQQIPSGVVFGLGALLVGVIGWAAYRHHRLSMSI
jgi:hypothetical protein